MKKIFFLAIITFSSSLFSQSVKIDTVISENKITTFTSQKLILLDFWATWCAPCVSATQQLEILQENNKDKVFVISISDEDETKISRYLEKRPIDIMVTSDYNDYTFSKYNIVNRPFAVLLDIDGNLLWKGHPSDMTQKKLDEFYNKQESKVTQKKFQKIIEEHHEKVVVKNKLAGNESIKFFPVKDAVETLFFENNEANYSGKLSNLFFELKDIYPYEIDFEADADIQVGFVCALDYWHNNKDLLLVELLDYYNLRQTDTEKEVTVLDFHVENKSMLWNDTQFSWEGSPVNYIIGTDRIQADNMTIKSICKLLSKAKNANYYYSKKDEQLYDWDFQYLYDELLVEELESGFGIKLKPKNISVNLIRIQKKE